MSWIDRNSKYECKKSSWSNLKWICKTGSSCVLWPTFVQIESRGSRVKNLDRRHISTSGLASSALGMLFIAIFCLVLPPYRTQTARNAFCQNTGCTKSKSWPGSTIQKPELLPKMPEMVWNAVKFIFIRKMRDTSRRQTGSSGVLWPTFGQIGIRGHWVRKTGRRHISTFGLASRAPGMLFFCLILACIVTVSHIDGYKCFL